jgi:hypothetical protein
MDGWKGSKRRLAMRRQKPEEKKLCAAAGHIDIKCTGCSTFVIYMAGNGQLILRIVDVWVGIRLLSS